MLPGRRPTAAHHVLSCGKSWRAAESTVDKALGIIQSSAHPPSTQFFISFLSLYVSIPPSLSLCFIFQIISRSCCSRAVNARRRSRAASILAANKKKKSHYFQSIITTAKWIVVWFRRQLCGSASSGAKYDDSLPFASVPSGAYCRSTRPIWEREKPMLLMASDEWWKGGAHPPPL